MGGAQGGSCRRTLYGVRSLRGLLARHPDLQGWPWREGEPDHLGNPKSRVGGWGGFSGGRRAPRAETPWEGTLPPVGARRAVPVRGAARRGTALPGPAGRRGLAGRQAGGHGGQGVGRCRGRRPWTPLRTSGLRLGQLALVQLGSACAWFRAKRTKSHGSMPRAFLPGFWVPFPPGGLPAPPSSEANPVTWMASCRMTPRRTVGSGPGGEPDPSGKSVCWQSRSPEGRAESPTRVGEV